MTSMIATCSVERKNIDVRRGHCTHLSPHLSSPSFSPLSQESISTCRFSQRVALVKNEPTLNEELDPKLVSLSLTSAALTLSEHILVNPFLSAVFPCRWCST